MFTLPVDGPPLVLDGGLSTDLEAHGADLSSDLWSARLLRDDPQAVLDAHRRFWAAGAQVVSTASYQASVEAFARAGLSASGALALVRRSVELAREAVDGSGAFVAGSVGPYGAMLADGSEYTGNYGPDVDHERLRAFYAPTLATLADAGVDVLACETLPSVADVRAVLEEVRRLDVPAWLSLTTVTGPDGVVRTRRGEPAEQAFALAADVPQVVAVGVNCTEPDGVLAAVEVAVRAAGKPVVVYPNSGEGWDAVARSWTGSPDPGELAGFAPDWVAAGARLVGGCCRVSPEAIAALVAELA